MMVRDPGEVWIFKDNVFEGKQRLSTVFMWWI